MDEISLTKEEKNLLTYCLEKHNPELLSEINNLNLGHVNNQMVNKIRDTIGSELIAKGFNNKWEPNEYGLKLENLIDRLARLFWK
jgi:hypothetical protein